MAAHIRTILIFGATSGIGEQFTRYFHSQGKKVIAAGRRAQHLNNLQKELRGLETFQIDVTDVSSLESKIQVLIEKYPDLDSAILLAGIMNLELFNNPSSYTTAGIISQVTTNVSSPFIISRVLVPHFISLNRPTLLSTVSSGLAYIPIPLFPVYNSTKAAIHAFSVSLRIQLADTAVKVVELIPPYVDTGLDAHFREASQRIQGENAAKPMPLKEYMDTAIAGFESGEKEIATGFSKIGIDAWRGAFGPILDNFKLVG